ncbi:hypothetical protein EF876_02005 [Erysipelothrix rhusiopathiae]|nr:hypothetical protein [Erysipelothrix rhusiopathiae]RNM32032.1 hypothetical protein EF876_02005 [Erysipelothrix rhusiopathiae]
MRLVKKAAFAGYIMYISFIFLIGNAASFQNLFNDIYFIIGTIILYFSSFIKKDNEIMTVHRYGSKINFVLKTIGKAVFHASVLYIILVLFYMTITIYFHSGLDCYYFLKIMVLVVLLGISKVLVKVLSLDSKLPISSFVEFLLILSSTSYYMPILDNPMNPFYIFYHLEGLNYGVIILNYLPYVFLLMLVFYLKMEDLEL